jgi:hypothetical protein
MISTISKRIELSLEPCHLGEPSGAPKMISEQMVRLAQIVHRSCTESNTISKKKEVRFHMTHVSKLKKRLALSLKGPKQGST